MVGDLLPASALLHPDAREAEIRWIDSQLAIKRHITH